MADLNYIANSALDLVGQSQILSIDDSTPAAKKCKLHIYEAIREVLKLGKWKAARKQATLAQLTQGPAFGWTYAYQLPADYLRMVRFNDSDPQNVVIPVFEIQGKQLLTSEPVANLAYVCDLSMAPNDISAAGPELVELFAVKLAQKMAWSFQQSKTLKESLEQEYQMKRRLALAADAQETKNTLVNRLDDSEWLRERRFSTNA
jgi:hypothetical protein